MNKGKLTKRIFLGVFLCLGTIIILLAGTIMMNFIMADNVDSKSLTRDVSEFVTLYDEFPKHRDIPQGLMVADARCELGKDIYTIKVNLKNTTTIPKNICLQLYFNEKMANITSDFSKPFLTVNEDAAMIIPGGEQKEFTFTGTLDSSTSPEELKEAMDYIYMEVMYANRTGRIMLPIVFVEK